jgi:hypothetical protein
MSRKMSGSTKMSCRIKLLIKLLQDEVLKSRIENLNLFVRVCFSHGSRGAHFFWAFSSRWLFAINVVY